MQASPASAPAPAPAPGSVRSDTQYPTHPLGWPASFIDPFADYSSGACNSACKNPPLSTTLSTGTAEPVLFEPFDLQPLSDVPAWFADVPMSESESGVSSRSDTWDTTGAAEFDVWSELSRSMGSSFGDGASVDQLDFLVGWDEGPISVGKADPYGLLAGGVSATLR